MTYQLDNDGFPYPTAEVAETKEKCITCKESIYFNYTAHQEWSHWHGSSYCRDRNGFSSSAHTKAQPAMYSETVTL